MKHILIVDDNPTNLRLATSVLEYEGYEISQVSDAEEAQKFLTKRIPDLILMDIWLPGMDGLELTRRVKADPKLQHIPVIALTAFAMKGDDEKARDAGCAAYITKPIDTREFAKQIADVLGAAKPLRLLIVDDQEANLRLLDAQLEAEGHAVVRARNGIEALGKLESDEFDGVISDILMPGMDGYRLCLEVRKNARFNSLPFVLYTSTYNSLADRELAASAGADAYIEKPAPIGTIVAAVRGAIGRSRSPVLPEVAQNIESPVLKQYSEVLIRKLEERSVELERAYDGIARTEALLSGVVESAMDAIVATDSSMRIILFNAAAERMFGCPAREAIGLSIERFIPGWFDEAGADSGSSEDSVPRGTASPGTRLLWASHLGGADFPIEASTSVLETSRGALHTIFARDITERHRAERALAESAAALRQAQLVARLAHIVTGSGGVFESWSDTLPDLIGVDADAVPKTTRDWLGFIHPQDRERFRSRAIQTGREGVRSEIEYRFRRDGDWVHVRQVLMPLPAEGIVTKPTRWFSTLQDVTDQKQAELRIRSQNRVLSVLSSISALIIRANDIEELLDESCRIAVDAGHFSIAWIGLVDEPAQSLRFAAGQGATPEFYDSLRSTLPQVALGGDSFLAAAIRHQKTMTLNDVQWAPPPVEPAQAPEARSLAALPLVIGGRAIGVIVLRMELPGFFDSEELKLLRDLASDISYAMDRLEKSKQIQYLANYDVLTGLPNRSLFSERLKEAQRTQDTSDAILAVVLLDVERLRRVNETLGRAAGDELLKEVASRLLAFNASIARIGIDVFAMSIRDKRTGAEVARAVEELVAACFSHPFNPAGEELLIGCRCGVSVYPADGDSPELLLNNAEAALRRAKVTAEHCVFYGPELNASAAEALKLESRLRRAIERHEFVLHYQPKVRFSDWGISGAEALIRWQDPERGLIAPGQFIPVLEESGLIGVVGEWALRQALRDQAGWRAAGLPVTRVAVNVSSLQLRRPEFSDLVAEVIGANGGAELELEITESMVMQDVEGTIATLRRIRALGVTIAIDDFGTGYSSLAYIAKLPVTSLKIDRSFIMAMAQGPESLAIVSSIIALAHALKLPVVAEGVETEAQAQLLHLFGCDDAQGYLFSKPVPTAAFEALLSQGTLFALGN